MRFASVLATAAIVVSCGSGAVQAQTSNKAVPAEFPPASYTGRQYVDSKGCVFIRAGVDGAVTWVPRVTRSREHICGFEPTLSASARAQVIAPRATAAATDAEPAAKAPATAKAVQRKPEPAQAQTAAPKVAAVPAKPEAPAKPGTPPKAGKATNPAPAPEPRRVVVASCPGASALSRHYLNSTDRYSVRCGPQSAPHVTERATAGPDATVYRPGTYPAGSYYAAAPTRVAPRHVYEMQKASTDGVFVPEGYTTVWQDDRLNPQRAHQTLAGKAQMDATWTQTVPRRLKERKVGNVVVRDYSGLAAPSYSFAQKAAQAPVTETRATPARAEAAPPPAPADRAASHRYVQLGAFTDAANAKRVAQKLANSGLPARMGGITQKGQSLTLVLAGPFSTQAQLDNGLQRVRGMGYVQATLRK